MRTPITVPAQPLAQYLREHELMRRLEQCCHVYDDDARKTISTCDTLGTDRDAIAGACLAAIERGGLAGDDAIDILEAERFADHFLAWKSGERPRFLDSVSRY
jgi:hypothetical protein